MCFERSLCNLGTRYSHTVLYSCPCSMKTEKPRILRDYTKEEIDLLLSPSQKIGYHYYRRLGALREYKEIYCNGCRGEGYYRF